MMALSNETRLTNVKKRTRHRKKYVVLYQDEGCLFMNYHEPNEHQVTKEELNAIQADENKIVILVEFVKDWKDYEREL